jgi:hypothetical protein
VTLVPGVEKKVCPKPFLHSLTRQLNSAILSQGSQIAALTANATQFLTLSSANATFLTRASAAVQFQNVSGPIRFPDGTTQTTAAMTLLPPNLISNSYMNLVDGSGQPTGWSTSVSVCLTERLVWGSAERHSAWNGERHE